MRLDDLVVRIDRGKLSIADADDFRALTGKSLEQYVEEMQRGDRPVRYFDEILDPEMRALIWVFCRDQEDRDRIWDDPDELWRKMETDIRRLTVDDIESATQKMAEQEAPAAARAKRPTAAQKRAAKRTTTAAAS